MDFQNTLAFARSLDEQDPIKSFRDKFFIPQHGGKDCIYLTGNSLGLQPKTASRYVQQELDDWATLGVEGHFQAKIPGCPIMKFFRSNYQKSSVAKSRKWW